MPPDTSGTRRVRPTSYRLVSGREILRAGCASWVNALVKAVEEGNKLRVLGAYSETTNRKQVSRRGMTGPEKAY